MRSRPGRKLQCRNQPVRCKHAQYFCLADGLDVAIWLRRGCCSPVSSFPSSCLKEKKARDLSWVGSMMERLFDGCPPCYRVSLCPRQTGSQGERSLMSPFDRQPSRTLTDHYEELRQLASGTWMGQEQFDGRRKSTARKTRCRRAMCSSSLSGRVSLRWYRSCLRLSLTSSVWPGLASAAPAPLPRPP